MNKFVKSLKCDGFILPDEFGQLTMCVSRIHHFYDFLKSSCIKSRSTGYIGLVFWGNLNEIPGT